jgi:hypothetical protein
MNYDGPLYAPWNKVLQGRTTMQFNLEELKYLQSILNQSSSYAKARGEQVDHPSVSHQHIIQKIEYKIHKLSS